MSHIDGKTLRKMKQEGLRGTANNTRLFNYQIRVLLHFARIGLRSDTGNKQQREIIQEFKRLQERGMFDD